VLGYHLSELFFVNVIVFLLIQLTQYCDVVLQLRFRVDIGVRIFEMTGLLKLNVEIRFAPVLLLDQSLVSEIFPVVLFFQTSLDLFKLPYPLC
jgi:hypothetical protein